MALSLDARIAGYMPKIKPVPAAKMSAFTIVSGVIIAGSRVSLAIPSVNNLPTKMPRNPPNTDTRIDSARN